MHTIGKVYARRTLKKDELVALLNRRPLRWYDSSDGIFLFFFSKATFSAVRLYFTSPNQSSRSEVGLVCIILLPYSDDKIWKKFDWNFNLSGRGDFLQF